ncbi:MAG: nucleoside kinase [Oscillospiraceae bacterium]|jgi:uridine kinase|nr:nucleoside kinase [Oscillospiraceae bacterium]
MSIELSYILERLSRDAPGFVAECESEYARKVAVAASDIAESLVTSPIVLLSGPSGSGKTTTAKKLREELNIKGIRAHTVSLDDYFLSPSLAGAPKTPEGDHDFESPACIDWALLGEHFTALQSRRGIELPHFSFAAQTRSNKVTPLKLGRDEIAIFEGIHALSDRITGAHPEAYRLYISARSSITDGGAVFFKGTWARLVRRVIRDEMFRASDANFTLALWANVRRGEKAHISPFRDTARLKLDTLLPYELAAVKSAARAVFERARPGIERYDEVREILRAYERVPDFDTALVPKNSILREFLSGSSYEY